jgi:hypothetical protein
MLQTAFFIELKQTVLVIYILVKTPSLLIYQN